MKKLSFIFLISAGIGLWYGCTHKDNPAPNNSTSTVDCTNKQWQINTVGNSQGLVKVHDGVMELKVAETAGKSSRLGIVPISTTGFSGDFTMVVNFKNLSTNKNSSYFAINLTNGSNNSVAFISNDTLMLYINGKPISKSLSSTKPNTGAIQFKKSANILQLIATIGTTQVSISDTVTIQPFYLSMEADIGPSVNNSANETTVYIDNVTFTGTGGIKTDNFDCNSLQ